MKMLFHVRWRSSPAWEFRFEEPSDARKIGDDIRDGGESCTALPGRRGGRAGVYTICLAHSLQIPNEQPAPGGKRMKSGLYCRETINRRMIASTGIEALRIK
jgi:hypothetical protein